MNNHDSVKEKVKKVMVDHLTALGYPEMSPEQIMGQLKAMWIKIEEAGLIQSGMSYQAFLAHANDQYMISQINSMFRI